VLRWIIWWRRGGGRSGPDRPVRRPSAIARGAARKAGRSPWAPGNEGRLRGRIPDGDTVANPGFPRWSELVTRELPHADPPPSYLRPCVERDRKPLGEAGGWARP